MANDKINQDAEQQAQQKYARQRCPFFQIPQELRNKIYSHLFSSTKLVSAKAPYPESFLVCNDIVPSSPDPLAILRTCRQAYYEIGDTWLQGVLLIFANLETMFDKLTALRADALSRIRHLCVVDSMIYLMRADDSYETCSLSSLLRFLPGLRLDRLTVIPGPDEWHDFCAVEKLISGTDCWKELNWIDRSIRELGPRPGDGSGYAQQLSAQYTLTAQDAVAPQPFVDEFHADIYRRNQQIAKANMFRQFCPAPSNNPPRMELGSNNPPRMDLGPVLSKLQDIEGVDMTDSTTLIAPGTWLDEVIVVVREGTSIDYDDKNHSILPENSWQELQDAITRSKQSQGLV
ncbi:hypothetical protein F4779DRAFT_570308 [Xylariaceae sp. FL0662B]|nr:hypothetical protein F4779DRAFT_570308 [Xylariaceae sp. FL0662B]